MTPCLDILAAMEKDQSSLVQGTAIKNSFHSFGEHVNVFHVHGDK